MTLPVLPVLPVRPRIPAATARRIDRLSRGAHAFHRFAHHPLCGRYASEVIAVGRKTRVCRGCTAALSGIGLGLFLGLVLRPVPARFLLLGVVVSLPLTFVRAGPKVLRRSAPALALGCLATAGSWLTLGLSVALTFALLFGYRQRGPNRRPCETCPERSLEVCSGFRPLVTRERALQRRVRPWLA